MNRRTFFAALVSFVPACAPETKPKPFDLAEKLRQLGYKYESQLKQLRRLYCRHPKWGVYPSPSGYHVKECCACWKKSTMVDHDLWEQSQRKKNEG